MSKMTGCGCGGEACAGTIGPAEFSDDDVRPS